MIIPAQHVRIVVAVKPVDFRKGHDGLAAVVQSALQLDPYSGVIVVFRSRKADRIKVLLWDGTGLVMSYKRLEAGQFAWPKLRDGAYHLTLAQYEALFAGLDWRRVHAPMSAAPAATE
jgi:transposase